MFEKELNCGNLLSPNKRITEATSLWILPHAGSSRNSLIYCSGSWFPLLQSAVGPLSAQFQLLATVMSMAPLTGLLSARWSWTGRPAKDRSALATPFMVKAILNLPTTRDLIARLLVDDVLRQFCGWSHVRAVPHESKFSRAFAEFALTELPQQLHAAVIASTQKQRLIGHIARDSTAIPAREHFPETAKQKSAHRKAKKVRKRPDFSKTPARHQKLDRMLQDLPRQCDIGAKKNSQGTRDPSL